MSRRTRAVRATTAAAAAAAAAAGSDPSSSPPKGKRTADTMDSDSSVEPQPKRTRLEVSGSTMNAVQRLLSAVRCGLRSRVALTITNEEMKGALYALNNNPKYRPLLLWFCEKTRTFGFQFVLEAIGVNTCGTYDRADLDPRYVYDVLRAVLISLSSSDAQFKDDVLRPIQWLIDRNVYSISDMLSFQDLMKAAEMIQGPDDHKWYQIFMDAPRRSRYSSRGMIVKGHDDLMAILTAKGHRVSEFRRFVAEGYQLGGEEVSVKVTPGMTVNDAIAAGNMVRFCGLRLC